MKETNTLKKAIFFLPIAFSIHNLEEVLTVGNLQIVTNKHFHHTDAQFQIAVLLFSIVGFMVVFLRNLYTSEDAYLRVIVWFAGMILLNVFIPHLLIAIITRSYTPGLASAILINLPLVTTILKKIKKIEKIPTKRLLLDILSGGGIGLALVFLFLMTGKLIVVAFL